jgi:hypothetical protein
VTVVAAGLENPRGLTFGPDGNLYVAEGGEAVTPATTFGSCTQVPTPIGPYTGSHTGRISAITLVPGAVAQPDPIVTGLPSSQTSPLSGELVSGVADVQFLGNTLYGLLAGAGCSHGVPDTPNGVIRINPDDSWQLVADLSAFQAAHPVLHRDPVDYEPDGTWYSMVAVRGDLYAVEPNHQELDRITPDGQVSRVLDLSVQFPGQSDWVGPTGLAYHGNFYVGTLGMFPLNPGTQSIYKITPSGQLSVAAAGLTAVVSVAFDHDGQLYALEAGTQNLPDAPFPAPFTGKVVRVSADGTPQDVATGLAFPTAMTFGPDGALYVSNFGFGFPAGAGQIVRIDVSPASPAAGPATVAAGLSQPAQGPFATAADGGPDGAAPVHRHTQRVLAGNFPATDGFTVLTPQPAGNGSDANALLPTRSRTTTPIGTHLIGMDSGVLYSGADGRGTLTSTVSIVVGARKYRRAAGSTVAAEVRGIGTGQVVGTSTGGLDRLTDGSDDAD